MMFGDYFFDNQSHLDSRLLSDNSVKTITRKHSLIDAGYCSNNSSKSCSDTGVPRFDTDCLSLSPSFSVAKEGMDIETLEDVFFSFEKPAQDHDHTAESLHLDRRPKSASIWNAKPSIFSQSENSAFFPSSSRLRASSVVEHLKTVPELENISSLSETVTCFRRSNTQLQGTPQVKDEFLSPPNRSHLLRNQCFENPRSFRNSISGKTDAPFFRNSKIPPLRPEPIRRQQSDSIIYEPHYASKLLPANDCLDYSKQQFNPLLYIPDQKWKENKLTSPLGKPHFLGTPILTPISESNIAEFSTDDILHKFSDSFQENSNSPVCSPCHLALSNDIATRGFSSSSAGESKVTGNPSSVEENFKVQPSIQLLTEDEAWRSYLENPLTTAATTALMSIQEDEDSAAALDILYDYYKVPREKRVLTYQPSDQILSSTSRSTSVQNPVVSDNENISEKSFLQSAVSKVSSNNITYSKDQVNGPRVPDENNKVLSHARLSRGVDAGDSDVTIFAADKKIIITGEALSHSPTCLNEEQKTFSEMKPNLLSLTSDQTSHESLNCLPRQVPPFEDCDQKFHFYQPTWSSSPDLRQNSMSVVNSNRIKSNSSKDGGNNAFPTSSLSELPVKESPTCFNMFSPPNHAGYRFQYTMEAPKSLKQKEGEPTMSYINKGQFYCISLRECSGLASRTKNSQMTSIVQVVFGDRKPEEVQLQHWKYWYARQHTAKQRIIDIADYKESHMISNVEEFAHNAIRFNWDANDVAKIFINCNCLSTDFSAQKGIKGLPLLLQIDTYTDYGRSVSDKYLPEHRGVCQLKVFCDKGAERKIRDEERKSLNKKQNATSKGSTISGAGISPSHQFDTISLMDIKPIITSSGLLSSHQSETSVGHNVQEQKKQDTVYFKTITNCSVPAVYFVPDTFAITRNHVIRSPANKIPNDTSATSARLTPTISSDMEQAFFPNQGECLELLNGVTKRRRSFLSSEEGEFPITKVPKFTETDESKKVLLYVRKNSDDVYDGIMLREPSLVGLKQALQEKYLIPAEKMTKVLKKSKKGILVNIDDNIVRHYSNEDVFVIDILSESSDECTTYKIILNAI